MSFPKLLVLIGLVLFGTIGVAAFFKKGKTVTTSSEVPRTTLVEVELKGEVRAVESRNETRLRVRELKNNDGATKN